jgi:hypothetical protein
MSLLAAHDAILVNAMYLVSAAYPTIRSLSLLYNAIS